MTKAETRLGKALMEVFTETIEGNEDLMDAVCNELEKRIENGDFDTKFGEALGEAAGNYDFSENVENWASTDDGERAIREAIAEQADAIAEEVIKNAAEKIITTKLVVILCEQDEKIRALTAQVESLTAAANRPGFFSRARDNVTRARTHAAAWVGRLRGR